MNPEIRAIGLCAVLDVELEGLLFEKPGVLGEEAEENADKETFKLMPLVSAFR